MTGRIVTKRSALYSAGSSKIDTEYTVSIERLDEDSSRLTGQSKKVAKAAKEDALKLEPSSLGEEVEDK